MERSHKFLLIAACFLFLTISPSFSVYAESDNTFKFAMPRPYFDDSSILIELLFYYPGANSYYPYLFQINSFITNTNNSSNYTFFDNIKYEISVSDKSLSVTATCGVEDYLTFGYSCLYYMNTGSIATMNSVNDVGSHTYTYNMSSSPLYIVGYHVLGAPWSVTDARTNASKAYSTRFAFEYSDSTSAVMGDMSVVMQDILEELQADEVGDVPDTSEKMQAINDYAASEQEVIDAASEDVDIGSTIDIQLNTAASDSIWDVITNIFNVNPKIFSAVITILSIGIIAFFFNR